MPYSDYAKNQMLGGTAWTSLCDRVSLHTANPGSSGASEATGGSPAYARKTITWNTSGSGEVTASNAPVFDIPAGTYKFVGFWQNTGTHWLGYASIPDSTFSGQGTLTCSTTTADLNESPSA